MGDSAWIEDPKVRDKFQYTNVEKIPLDDLGMLRLFEACCRILVGLIMMSELT